MKKNKINFRIYYLVMIISFMISCSNKGKRNTEQNKENNSMSGMDMSNAKDTSMAGMDMAETPDTSANKMEGMDMNTSADSTLVRFANETYHSIISDQKSVKAVMNNLNDTIIANGIISFDARRNNKIAVRSGGRIEKLYIKYNYQHVSKGDKILDLYSPELSTFEDEYLYLLKNNSDKTLLENSKQKLLLFGLSESQISLLEKSGNSTQTISIYSPYSGYVLFNLNDNSRTTSMSSSSASPGMGGMGGAAKSSPQNYSSTNNEQIREGMYVNKGQTLFAVNDFKEVWAVISIDSKQQTKIKVDGVVKIKSEVAEENVTAKINFIEPYFEDGSRYSRVRVYLSNQKNLFKLNSFITAQFNFSLNALLIPSAAILDLGNKKVVWLKTGTIENGKNIYKVHIVGTGVASKYFTEIISGLSADDEVASDAGYLLDSEGLVNSEKH
ncbi:MAG: efflux RND transporter periplasmic adaptor subunit [Bacteroidota bacterium]